MCCILKIMIFYSSLLRAMNIKFTKLGLEECEVCEMHRLHVTEANHNHETSENEGIDPCETCKMWNDHNLRARTSREEYQKDKNNHKAVIMSVDLQKVCSFKFINSLLFFDF